MTASAQSSSKPRVVYGLILIPSIVLGVFYRMTLPGSPESINNLPMVMATLNAISAGLLSAAFVNIRRKQATRHKRLNLMALVTSLLFLTTYVVYHYYQAEPVHYMGDYRAIYFFILLTHVPLAAAIVPLAILTVIRGLGGSFDKHRRIARLTLPLWLYVSVTGVIIYFMLNF